MVSYYFQKFMNLNFVLVNTYQQGLLTFVSGLVFEFMSPSLTVAKNTREVF